MVGNSRRPRLRSSYTPCGVGRGGPRLPPCPHALAFTSCLPRPRESHRGRHQHFLILKHLLVSTNHQRRSCSSSPQVLLCPSPCPNALASTPFAPLCPTGPVPSCPSPPPSPSPQLKSVCRISVWRYGQGRGSELRGKKRLLPVTVPSRFMGALGPWPSLSASLNKANNGRGKSARGTQ